MPRGIRLLLLEPGIDTAAQGDDVGEAALAKDIDGLCGTHAAGAVDNRRSISFDVGVFAGEDAVELKVRGVGDGGLGTLGGGADVDKRGARGNLADLGASAGWVGCAPVDWRGMYSQVPERASK